MLRSVSFLTGSKSRQEMNQARASPMKEMKVGHDLDDPVDDCAAPLVPSVAGNSTGTCRGQVGQPMDFPCVNGRSLVFS